MEENIVGNIISFSKFLRSQQNAFPNSAKSF